MLAIVPTANRPLYTVSASEYGVLPSSSDNAESACKGGMTLCQRGAACRGNMLSQLTLRRMQCVTPPAPQAQPVLSQHMQMRAAGFTCACPSTSSLSVP